jgi:ABC-2 type transport system permease protein
VADAKGKETEQPLDEWVDIGVFSEDPDDFSKEQAPLYLQKHRLHSGEQTITLQVPAGGKFVGVDPLIKLIDRDSIDNLQPLK